MKKRFFADLSSEHGVRLPLAKTILGAGLGLMLVAGLASIYVAVRADEADVAVADSFRLRQAVSALLGDLQDAETGQRGFLLTGDEKYLDPFNRAEGSFSLRFGQLLEHDSNNPEQQQSLSKLKSLAGRKLDELRRTIALERQGQHEQAIGIVRSGVGEQLMDDIRIELGTFSARARDLRATRQNAAAVFQRWLLLLICTSLVIATGLVSFFANTALRAVRVAQQRTGELENEIKLRRETEETLRQAQKIEALGQLTGGIAHDFNNLLTIMIGNLDTAQRRLANNAPCQDPSDLAAVLKAPLDSALKAARSAAQLTHRLLAFSRRQALEPVALDLNKLISGMSDMLRRTLGEAINLEAIMAGGLWPAFADANQVENALLNLCINARDAMPSGGRLTIETGNAYLDEAYTRQFGDVVPGQYVVLSVADSGTGIPAEVLDRVFEPFFTTKLRGEGSGLGLAMVHGFIKQSGGHIRIYSEVGHGTTVRIYLPRLTEIEQIATAPAARSIAADPMPRAISDETILLVEDNDGVREYTASALQELGYKVLAAADAPDALRLVDAGHPIDLLFTDVVLPSASGRELADKVLERRPGLPVLFTTGYTRNAIIHQGRLDAGVQLISKPYTLQNLARKIRELVHASQK